MLRNIHLAASSRRLRRARAVTSVGQTMPLIAFYMLGGKDAYYDLGGDYFHRHKAEGLRSSLVKHSSRWHYKAYPDPSPGQPRYFRRRWRGVHSQLADVSPERNFGLYISAIETEAEHSAQQPLSRARALSLLRRFYGS